ncbi:MAG TPA: lysylphosphatidylglycerol synthase domain-containing protein [Gaiellaceae bacterium]|nr:lysylphosphatidylglycerol synthase domain-containing protein [Gaiellaceae bacterium]
MRPPIPSPASARRALALVRSRPFRLALTAAFGFAGLAAAALTVRHFVAHGWPLANADPWLVVAAASLFLGAYACKAFGWKRLFARHERPSARALAAATGAATVTGLALPSRFDELVRITVVRRFRTSRAGLGAICLSIVLVGFLDSAALTPLASVAAGLTHVSALPRAGLSVVAAAGIASAAIVAVIPRLGRFHRLARFRLVRWLEAHSADTVEASKAWVLISASWALRATALYVLFLALGLRASFVLALLFLCASAASAALPVAPAGAATQAGAGAAMLALSGVGAERAVAFAIAAQGLVVLSGAAVVVLAGAWEARLRLLPAGR